ncbi:MAG: hypothetical protein ACOX69_02755 [Coriobacteriales bacterium]|jgi:hypothetical protein
MERDGYSSCSSVVLTTSERLNLFTSVLGDGVDARLDPDETLPLDDFLCNVACARGKLVVLDEFHFYEVDDLLVGLERFLDIWPDLARRLRIVVVCSQRKAGDPVLTRLAAYCQIPDLIWDCRGGDVTIGLAEMLRKPCSRVDVLELLRAGLGTNTMASVTYRGNKLSL